MMGGYCEGCGATGECFCEEFAEQLNKNVSLIQGLNALVKEMRKAHDSVPMTRWGHGYMDASDEWATKIEKLIEGGK